MNVHHDLLFLQRWIFARCCPTQWINFAVCSCAAGLSLSQLDRLFRRKGYACFEVACTAKLLALQQLQQLNMAENLRFARAALFVSVPVPMAIVVASSVEALTHPTQFRCKR